MKTVSQRAVAYFISAHGLGHAARAAAVMDAVHAIQPDVRFEIFSTVPRWFFDDCLSGPFTCHTLQTDVGLVQHSPLEENLPATIEALEAFYPLDEKQLQVNADKLRGLGCRLVICDIAPLGIAVAHQAGLPSLLVENFTWDWIYAGYSDYLSGLKPHINYLEALFAQADYHVQTEPVCAVGSPDLVVPPIGRLPRTPADEVRQRLGVPAGKQLVVITLGGTATSAEYFQPGDLSDEIFLVIPGNSDQIEQTGSIVRLPVRSNIYHPDPVRAADVVIGKAGYSTLAEVYLADVPFGFVSRSDFREAPVLEAFTRRHLRSLSVSPAALADGSWAPLVPAMAALPAAGADRVNGAESTSAFILEVLSR